ncbi:restriction endonuclease subunit S [Streptomyces sp. NPDC093991]|uniref:restriction endonuclease subunit S n=1 Tax=unclassified Streptomyces TaxID=2593676 RepID=UPI0034278E6F
MRHARLPYGAGSTPGTWAIVPLKYLATLTNGYVFNSADRSDEGTPIIRIENLNGSSNFNCSTLSLPDKYRVEAGDLLFSWSGNPGTSFGPYLWTEPGQYYLNQHIFKVGVYGCDPRWLYWALKAATHWIERQLTSGMIGMVHVTKEDLAGVPIPVPPMEEQRRIAEFLDTETARIDDLARRQSNQSQLLANRDVSDLSEVYQKLMREYGAIRLRHMLLRIEQGWSPQCDDRRVSGHEWGVIKAGCVNGGIFDPAQHKALPDQVSPRQEYALREGDLLMSRASGSTELIGSVGIVPELEYNLLLCDKVYRLSLDFRLGRVDFVAHMLRSHMVREHIKMGVSGGEGMANNLPTAVVKDCVLPKTPLSVQASTARKLHGDFSRTARVRNALRRSIKLLSGRRQALITAAVTGQFDVSTASGRNVTEGVSA